MQAFREIQESTHFNFSIETIKPNCNDNLTIESKNDFIVVLF